MLDANDVDGMVDVVDDSLDRWVLRVDDPRYGHDAEDTTRISESTQLVVSLIPRRLAYCSARRVAHDDLSTLRPLEHVDVRLFVRVREVDDRTECDKAVDQHAPKAREAAVWVFTIAVRERVSSVPCQSEHPKPELPENVGEFGTIAEGLGA